MIKNLKANKYFFALAILMSLLIVFSFGNKKVWASPTTPTATLSPLTNSGAWAIEIVDDEDNADKKLIKLTNYSEKPGLKNIVIPNANDFLDNDDSSCFCIFCSTSIYYG